ncbi:TPA: glycosyltransferase [Vibrio vulnificus]
MLKEICNFLFFKFGYNRFPPVYDLGFDGRENQRRVLVSYLSDGLSKGLSSFKFSTNRHENAVIINEFINQGYLVDVYDCRDEISKLNDKKYDVIFGFGHPFRNGELAEGGLRVLYCTESHPSLMLIRESRRIEDFNARHNASLKNERSGSYYKVEDYTLADKFYVMGSLNADYLVNDIKISCGNISLINPTGIEPSFKKLELESEANDFLWFGSRGFVLKGLDLVIEAFLQCKIKNNLHICGVEEKVIKKFYPNLDERFIFYGQVDAKDDSFKDILKRCSYIILASASEGVSTSILTGMRHGLIPILSKECGLKLGDLGIELDECSISEIRDVIIDCSKKERAEIDFLSKEVYDYANKKFCLTSYEKQVSELLLRLK